jgi:NADH:ubiquinone oxidoreductase subunit
MVRHLPESKRESGWNASIGDWTTGVRRGISEDNEMARNSGAPFVRGHTDMKILLQFFTWWNGQTLGTRFFTWRFGKRVGEDEFGNIYYEGPLSSYGLPKRWVVYNGYAEASAIPPGWHGWMHHRTDTPPSREKYEAREWEKGHKANLTGTPMAYRPKGSLATGGERDRVTGDYDAWTPRS